MNNIITQTAVKTTNPIMNIAIFNGIVKFLKESTVFFLGIFLNSVGFTGFQIGILITCYTLTGIITLIPSGFGNDKFKSKTLIAISLLLLGILYLGISLTNNFILTIPLFILGGIGRSLYAVSADSLFYKSTTSEQAPRQIGLFQGINYLMLGAGIFTAGYLLNTNLSFSNVFALLGIAFFIMAFISHFALPINPSSEFEIVHYKKDLLRPKVLLFLLIMFLFAFHFGAEETSYGLFLKNNLHLNNLQIGAYMSFAIMTMAFTSYFFGKNIGKIKAKYILLFGIFISGIGHILMTVESPILSLVFRILHETGDAAMFFFLYYGITKLFDINRIGGNTSIFALATTSASALGAFIFGPLGAKFGYNIPFIVSGGSNLLAFLLAIIFLKHFDHK